MGNYSFIEVPAIREARGHLTAGKDRYLLSYGVMVNTPPFGGGTSGSNPDCSTGRNPDVVSLMGCLKPQSQRKRKRVYPSTIRGCVKISSNAEEVPRIFWNQQLSIYAEPFHGSQRKGICALTTGQEHGDSRTSGESQREVQGALPQECREVAEDGIEYKIIILRPCEGASES